MLYVCALPTNSLGYLAFVANLRMNSNLYRWTQCDCLKTCECRCPTVYVNNFSYFPHSFLEPQNLNSAPLPLNLNSVPLPLKLNLNTAALPMNLNNVLKPLDSLPLPLNLNFAPQPHVLFMQITSWVSATQSCTCSVSTGLWHKTF